MTSCHQNRMAGIVPACLTSYFLKEIIMNDQVNRDAASDVPTSETKDGGSGSTDCSFSAIGENRSFEECLAGLILNSGKSVLKTIGEIMFLTASRLPPGENREMWEDISDVYWKYSSFSKK